jgi:hypothetical protein
MKTITLDVTPEIAKRFLADYENTIAEKTRERNFLDNEISTLQEGAKAIRSKLQNGDGQPDKAPKGENKARIVEYLTKAGSNGATMTEISSGTGIGVSSVNFTLTHENNKTIFEKVGKTWRLKS